MCMAVPTPKAYLGKRTPRPPVPPAAFAPPPYSSKTLGLALRKVDARGTRLSNCVFVFVLTVSSVYPCSSHCKALKTCYPLGSRFA